MRARRSRGSLSAVIGLLLGAELLAARAAAAPINGEACGDGTTFTVPLPSVGKPYSGIAESYDDSITLPNGCRIYALFVSGYADNANLDQLMFYRLAKLVMENDGYVHWAWWNNLLREYMGGPLHNERVWLLSKFDWVPSSPGSLDPLQPFLAGFLFEDAVPKAIPHEDSQFQADATRMLAAIRERNPNAIVIVAGHSMGGDAVARLGANTSVDIDLLAPIDPVGNRSSPAGRVLQHTYNWTRWRATHEFYGYKRADCVRDYPWPYPFCHDFDPRWWAISYQCEPAGVGGWLEDPPFPSSLWVGCHGPYEHPGVQRSFGLHVKRLYHRWQHEFLFPFDPLANYEFNHWAPLNQGELNPGSGALSGARNLQFAVDAQALGEAPDPYKTCAFGHDPRDPTLECSPTDGHGEIVGYRDPSPGATNPAPLALKAQWPDDGVPRRTRLVEMATPGDWPYAPIAPGLCMVSQDMILLLGAIMAEQPPPADVTAPNTVATLDPVANESGWHNGDVVVTLKATDGPYGTGVGELEYSLAGAHVGSQVVTGESATMTLSAEGETTLTFFARDRAQPVPNVEEAKTIHARIDRTTPVIEAVASPPANQEGWNATDVSVSFISTDALSGVSATSPAVLVTSEGAAQEIIGTASDFAGNQASASAILNIDKTAPSVTIGMPLQGATYLLHASVASAYSCEDLLSGLRACAGPSPSGAPFDTATVGAKQFTVDAIDGAGNRTVRAHLYSVLYGFSGFQRPVSPPPAVNVSKAGSTVPLKWSLYDVNGAPVLDPAAAVSIESAAAACDAGAPAVELAPAEPTGETSLRVEDGVFIFNWKTSGAWSGCRVLELTLLDGTRHRLTFSFK